MEIDALNHQHGQTTLSIPHLEIKPDQHWLMFSSSGNHGELFATLLAGMITPQSGTISGTPEKVGLVSLSSQQALLEDELANDDTDFLDRIDPGTSVQQLIEDCCISSSVDVDSLMDKLDLVHLADRGFRQLSTGETRRLMLARAMATEPDLLILDDPYSGLDVAHRETLSDIMNELVLNHQLIILTSRLDDLPDCVTHVCAFSHEEPLVMTRDKWLSHPIISQLSAQTSKRSDAMVELLRKNKHQTALPDPLVKLTNGRVAYTDTLIFEKVNWQINHGEHWQIRGPNGCGKSTLLGLIFGDHPQCYSNDIDIFGFKRGSGETIWDIKRHIGMVSSALHLEYRVGSSALDTVISGLHDSIGLYQKPTKAETDKAMEWLKIFHMESLAKTSFRRLEYGQQRLLLIARALIKRPALLILDEPYQGLDFLSRKLVANALQMIAEEHLSQLLFVSHHNEDKLSGINHFIDFEPTENAHRVIISHQ
ncbi:ABC transporter [Veronia nyctiphanis]|uniref:ABC transporter n=1 Tax=Veronia nyctiphanis TaxID=1278244 RepID=A0A4Q0YMI8_9GAMM|nr:ABC transporter [Veronia nyctiphanis]